MTIDNTAGANSRRTRSTTQKARASRSTKAVASKSTATSEQTAKTDTLEVTGEEVMSADDMVKLQAPSAQEKAPDKAPDKASKQSAIAIHHHDHVAADGPLMSSEFDIAETISSAGIRPIEASHLELAGSFMNGRPIASSSMTVYDMLPGDRPVFNSEIKMVEGLMLMNRPVMQSSPDLMQGSSLPGGRPIASNQNVDPEPEILMGYLD